MNDRCQDCMTLYTSTSDPRRWGFPRCEEPAPSAQTFAVDPYAIRTQFAPATRPAFPTTPKETEK
jgi:hypothetical protein